MLSILFISKEAFISASLVTKLQRFFDAYRFVWATIWKTNLFKSIAFSKTLTGLVSVKKCSNMFAVRSHCTFLLGLSVLFQSQGADFFLEWAEQLKEGLPDDELGTLAAETRISDAFATEPDF